MIALAALLFAVAPIAKLSDAQLDAKLTEVQKILNVGDRIDAVSALFVGTPYTEHPLGEGGEGPEPQPRWRLDGVDCQTFVETVLALANAKSTSHAKSLLDDIRYSAPPFSFSHRNHFTEAQAIDGHAPTAELVLHRAQWMKNAGLARLGSADIPEGKFPIRYLTPAMLKKRRNSIEVGSIILVVRDEDPKRVVRTSHMGFVLRGPSGLFVRHATSGAEHKVIDEPLDDYLARMDSFKKWPVIGFGLVMPLDAKVRASQVQAQP